MKVLLVYIKSPFAVSDGVSTALNSLMDLMIKIYINVDVFIVNENRIYTNVNSKSNEQNMQSMIFDGIDYNSYSLVVASPITSFMRIKKDLPKLREFILITQISDCIVYELWISFLLSLKFRRINPKSILKIPFYYYHEYLMNKSSDIVLLQTERDVEIISSLYSSKKGIAIPNLVLKDSIPLKKVSEKNMDIGWCATFKGDYLILAKWFCKKVIVPFMENNDTVKMSLLGNGNIEFCEYLKEQFPKFSRRFISNKHIENISQYYASHKVIICPVYKGYGLINKTIEAMLYGSIVLGDKAAFNGISDASDEENCLIAESPKDFITSLEKVFTKLSDQEIFDIGEKASQLISDQFSRDKNIKKILKALKDL
jgi:hypothetical protein